MAWNLSILIICRSCLAIRLDTVDHSKLVMTLSFAMLNFLGLCFVLWGRNCHDFWCLFFSLDQRGRLEQSLTNSLWMLWSEVWGITLKTRFQKEDVLRKIWRFRNSIDYTTRNVLALNDYFLIWLRVAWWRWHNAVWVVERRKFAVSRMNWRNMRLFLDFLFHLLAFLLFLLKWKLAELILGLWAHWLLFKVRLIYKNLFTSLDLDEAFVLWGLMRYDLFFAILNGAEW